MRRLSTVSLLQKARTLMVYCIILIFVSPHSPNRTIFVPEAVVVAEVVKSAAICG